MEMANFSGLIYLQKILNKINMLNTMKDNGGVVSLMAKEYIKKLMVNLFFINIGDFYTGNFKNGLKHG